MLRTLALGLLSLLGLAVLLWATVLGWLWLQQERLLFHPTPLPAGYPLAQASDVQELTVAVEGAQLSVLHLRRADAKGVVFFLHGNAGNLASWFSNADFYRQARMDLVMMDYRGYGKSTGQIESAAQLRADVRAVWEQVAAQYAGRRVVLYGRSLGSGLAAELAADLSAQGLAPDLTVLVSPYASLRELAKEFYPWVPGGLLRYPLDTAAQLPRVRGPVLLLHGERDTLIGVHHARRLQQLAPASRLVVLPGAGHNDIQDAPHYRQALAAALQAL